MYSLNVPVPGRVARLASDLGRELPAARLRTRGTHTLGVKRLGNGEQPYARLEARVRELVRDQSQFDVQVTDIGVFTEPITGQSPVVYLTVESQPLRALHEQLTTVFEPVEGIEGDGYTPHVTVARGGSHERATQLAERSIDPISWTVSELAFWDAKQGQTISKISLTP